MPDILLLFERQILRKTFRPIQPKEGLRIRNNKEIEKSIKREDIVKHITAQIIKRLGYLNRMEDIKLVTKMIDLSRTGVKPKDGQKIYGETK